jgi:hypothetical protein
MLLFPCYLRLCNVLLHFFKDVSKEAVNTAPKSVTEKLGSLRNFMIQADFEAHVPSVQQGHPVKAQ